MTDPASPTQQIKLSSRTEYPVLSCLEQEHVYIMGSIYAPLFEKTERAPINLVAVIDKSGSMAGQKLQLVKKTCQFMIQQLKKSDLFSLVTYDEQVTLELPLQHMANLQKVEANRIIEGVREGSTTNLSGGLLTGIQQFKGKSENNVSSIFLFTDGLANSGITTTNELVLAVQNSIKGMGTPCSIYCFGFGADHDPTMLNAVANAANGMYYYIAKEDDISVSFGDALGGLLSVAAQNIEITITPINGTKIIKVLGVIQPIDKEGPEKKQETEEKKEEVTPKEKCAKKTKKEKTEKEEVTKTESQTAEAKVEGSTSPVTLKLGDLYSEEGRDIVCSVQLPATENEGEFSALELTLAFFNVISCQFESSNLTCKAVRQKHIPQQKRDIEIDKQINRLLAAECMKQAQLYGQSGDLEKARELIQYNLDVIKNSVSSNNPLCIQLIKDLEEIYKDMATTSQFQNTGTKKAVWLANAHSRQRAAGNSGAIYGNQSKSWMISKFSSNNSLGRGKGGKASGNQVSNQDEDDVDEAPQQVSKPRPDLCTDKGGKGLGKPRPDISTEGRGKGGKGLGKPLTKKRKVSHDKNN